MNDIDLSVRIVGPDGRYLLQGTETWYYENGQKQWQADYHAGRKAGEETYWSPDGARQWRKVHKDDGTYDWYIYDSAGKLTAQSEWRGENLLNYKINEP